VPEYASTHNHAESGSDVENERGSYGDPTAAQALPLDENAHVCAPSAPSEEAWPAEEVGGDEAVGAHGGLGAPPTAAGDEECVCSGLFRGVNPLARQPSLPAGGWCVEQRTEDPVSHAGGATDPRAVNGVKKADGGAGGAADMPLAAKSATATGVQPQPSARTFAPPADAQSDLRARIARGPPLLAVFDPPADSSAPGVVSAEAGRNADATAPSFQRTSTTINAAVRTAASGSTAAAGVSAGTVSTPVRTPPLPRSWHAAEAPSALRAAAAAPNHGSGSSTAAACAPAQQVQTTDAIDALTSVGTPAGASKKPRRAPVARAVSHAELLAPRSRVHLLASATPVAAAGSSRALLTLASPRSPGGSPPGFVPSRAALSAAGAAVLSSGRLHSGIGSTALGSPGAASPTSPAQRTPSLATTSPGEAGGLLLARQRSSMRLLTERLPDDRPRGRSAIRAPISGVIDGIGATSAW
jgi:hypothetical protein